MTKALIWRYVYGLHPPIEICMFGGKLVDKISSYLSTGYEHRRTKTVKSIHYLSIMFQDYYEEEIEKPVTRHFNISGAKILDLLDCMEEEVGQKLKNIELEVYEPNKGNESLMAPNLVKILLSYNIFLFLDIYRLFCTYVIPRAWFTIYMSDKWKDFNKRHRFLSNSVRRLVDRHNEYILKDQHVHELRKIPHNYQVIWLSDNTISMSFRDEGDVTRWGISKYPIRVSLGRWFKKLTYLLL